MIIEVLKYDNEGKYVEPVLIEANDDGTYELPKNCTIKPLPQPNWKPVFSAELDDWVETITDDERAILLGNTLENWKNLKEKELNDNCNQAILDGFDHIIDGISYHFNFDIEAQLNFQGSERILDKGLVPAIEWTVTKDGQYERIFITKEIMDELVVKILQHKDSNVRRLRNELMPLVEAAESKDELDVILWK